MDEIYKQYDYLIVGAGLFGSVCAYELTNRGFNCLVIDKRNHIGGNVFTEKINNIYIHRYGSHVFHTDDKFIWNYINRFLKFNNFVNCPLIKSHGKLFNLPLNMNTFNKLWGVETPEKAKNKLNKTIIPNNSPDNLEEYCLSVIGKELYEYFIKEYTEKQWNVPCSKLPSFIIKRLPIRYTFNNNYFNDKYQGIPIGGYNSLFKQLLKNSDVKLNEDFNTNKKYYSKISDKIIYTGKIDEYYDYCFGELEYRSLKFKTIIKNISDFQGNAVINYYDKKYPYTRIIEHKHFDNTITDNTIITYEYPETHFKGNEPYYPINTKRNNELYKKYYKLSKNDDDIIFGGRLGEYKYYDMDKVIKSALNCVKKILG